VTTLLDLIPIPTATGCATATAPAPPKAATLPGDSAVVIPAELLDGGEVVILAVRPSLWFLVFEPIKWVAVAVVLWLGISWLTPSSLWGVSPSAVAQAIGLLLGVRLLVSVLRWVSRVYVLTNRRVMCIRGVLRPDLWECVLVRIRNTRLTAEPQEKLVGLGTIEFITEERPAPHRAWRYISRSEEIHAEVRKAIQHALDHHSPA
jgi:hypothetical protein